MFQCVQCEYRCAQNSNLKRHNKIVHDKIRYVLILIYNDTNLQDLRTRLTCLTSNLLLNTYKTVD